MPRHNYIYLLSAIFLLASCKPTVEEIRYGKDACHYCKMIISDPKFGAELVTEKGKVFKFDALECMVTYLEEPEGRVSNYAFVMAVSFDQPGTLYAVDQLQYLISPNIPSPMGAYLSAYLERDQAKSFQETYEGTLYQWEALQQQLAKR